MPLDQAQTNGLPGTVGYSLTRGVPHVIMDANAVAAPTNGTAYFIGPESNGNPAALRWSTKFASAPDAVSVKLQYSPDNSVWYDADSSTAVGGESKVLANVVPGFYRAQKTSQTNGGALTVTVTVS